MQGRAPAAWVDHDTNHDASRDASHDAETLPNGVPHGGVQPDDAPPDDATAESRQQSGAAPSLADEFAAVDVTTSSREASLSASPSEATPAQGIPVIVTMQEEATVTPEEG